MKKGFIVNGRWIWFEMKPKKPKHRRFLLSKRRRTELIGRRKNEKASEG